MCKEAGLPASGKKAELIARLEEGSAEAEKEPRMELEDLTCDVLRVSRAPPVPSNDFKGWLARAAEWAKG